MIAPTIPPFIPAERAPLKDITDAWVPMYSKAPPIKILKRITLSVTMTSPKLVSPLTYQGKRDFSPLAFFFIVEMRKCSNATIKKEMVIIEFAIKTLSPWNFLRIPPLAKNKHPVIA